MKLQASSKWLCALLAVLCVGMGVQTYSLVRVSRQLWTTVVRETEATASPGAQQAKDDSAATLPADPLGPLVPVDPLADLDQAEERMRSLFDDFYARFDRNFGDLGLDDHPFFADGNALLPDSEGWFGPRVDLQDRGGPILGRPERTTPGGSKLTQAQRERAQCPTCLPIPCPAEPLRSSGGEALFVFPVAEVLFGYR